MDLPQDLLGLLKSAILTITDDKTCIAPLNLSSLHHDLSIKQHKRETLKYRSFKRPGVPWLPRMELVANGTHSSQ